MPYTYGMYPLHFQQTFENFTIFNDSQRQVFETAKVFLTSNINIYLYGTTGVGKTHLASAVCNSLIANKITDFIFYRADDLFAKLVSYFDDAKIMKSILSDKKIIIIDDFYMPKSDFLYSHIQNMFDLIDVMQKKGMFITSNLRPIDFKNLFSVKTYSRLVGNFRIFEMTGEDMRERRQK